jgi:hypothetical protein
MRTCFHFVYNLALAHCTNQNSIIGVIFHDAAAILLVSQIYFLQSCSRFFYFEKRALTWWACTVCTVYTVHCTLYTCDTWHAAALFFTVHCAGIFFVLPCIETYQKVDLRTITLDVPPQEVMYMAVQKWSKMQRRLYSWVLFPLKKSMTVETDILRKTRYLLFISDCKASNAISLPNVLIRFSSFYHAIRKLLCRNVYKSRGSMVHSIYCIYYILQTNF